MEQKQIDQNLNISRKSYDQQPVDAAQASLQTTGGVSSWFAFSDPAYLKGFAAAAGITLLVASPAIRESIVKGSVKAWTCLQAGVEELKEKVQDVRAEMGQHTDSDLQKG